MRQEGWEWEGQNSGEQRYKEICGWERVGVGNTRYTRWTSQGRSGRKAGNLKEVGLGWIYRGKKDRGFGWGKIRGGGERLFRRPGGKNGIEESEGVYSKGGKNDE